MKMPQTPKSRPTFLILGASFSHQILKSLSSLQDSIKNRHASKVTIVKLQMCNN